MIALPQRKCLVRYPIWERYCNSTSSKGYPENKMINNLSYLEEMICELLCDELVPPGELHVTQSQQNPAKCGECFFSSFSFHLVTMTVPPTCRQSRSCGDCWDCSFPCAAPPGRGPAGTPCCTCTCRKSFKTVLQIYPKKDYDLFSDYLLILFLTSECPKRKAAAPKALATVGFTESLYPR
jgi:hypothetical protein